LAMQGSAVEASRAEEAAGKASTDLATTQAAWDLARQQLLVLEREQAKAVAQLNAVAAAIESIVTQWADVGLAGHPTEAVLNDSTERLTRRRRELDVALLDLSNILKGLERW